VNEKLERQVWKIADGLRSLSASLTPVEFAKKLRELDPSTPTSTLALLISAIPSNRTNFVPQFLADTIRELVKNKTAQVICDPWAGFGAIIATIEETILPEVAVAFTPIVDNAAVGQIIGNKVQWQVGDSLELLAALTPKLDIACSVLPFGLKSGRPFACTAADGKQLELRDDLGNLLLVAASGKLTDDGIGLFVVPQSFFFSQHSVLRHFNALGLGIEAALELPSGAFTPLTNISTYLVVIRRRLLSRMFVAQLSNDSHTNLQIITNLQQGGTCQ